MVKNTETTNTYRPSVPRLIAILEKHIALGYTHDNYRETARLFSTVSTLIEPDDSRVLGAFWRDSYTDDCDPVLLKAAVKSMKAKYRYGRN